MWYAYCVRVFGQHTQEDIMGRKKSVSSVDTALKARAEADLKVLPKGKLALKLIAIIAAGDDDRTLQVVADLFRVTRQSLAKWIQQYNRHGIEGLYDRPKGHRIKRLSPDQETLIQGWLENCTSPGGIPIHWTIDSLKMAINSHLGVPLGRTRVWLLMREWGFRQKVPRPHHTKADPEAQRAFKKNSPKW